MMKVKKMSVDHIRRCYAGQEISALLMIDTDYWRGPTFHAVQGGVEVHVKASEHNGMNSRVFIPEENFEKVVVLRRGFNSQDGASAKGEAVLWEYADGHGMELVAILRKPQEGSLKFVVVLPYGNTQEGCVFPDGRIAWTHLPTATRLEV